MKAIVEKKDLLPLLVAVEGVVEKRTTIPILANVLIEATGAGDAGRVSILGTDLDIQFTADCAAKVETAGAITVDAHRFAALVKAAGDGCQIALEIEVGALIVKANRSRWKLPTLPIADFPRLAVSDLPSALTIEKAGDFAAVLARLRCSISTEETRYYLNGIFVHAVDGKAVFASTDGHRLTRWVSDWAVPDGWPDIIIPRKMVAQIVKALHESKGAADIAVSASKIRVSHDGQEITGKLIDGTFPDYGRVIPADGAATVVNVCPVALTNAARRCALVAVEKTRGVKLTIEEARITAACSSPEGGSATEEVPAHVTGDGLSIAGNSTYLVELLNEGEGDVRLNFNDAPAPMRFDWPDMPQLTQVLMPMRV